MIGASAKPHKFASYGGALCDNLWECLL